MTDKIGVSGWSIDPDIKDHDWAALEAAGGVILSPENRRAIYGVIAEYIDAIALFRQSPRVSEVKPVLDRIALAASGLAAALRPRPASVQEAAEKMIDRAASRHHRRPYSMVEIRKLLACLAVDAKAANAELDQTDLGQEGDPYLGGLLVGLHRVFCAAGGRGKYTDHALTFLEQAVVLAGIQIHSRDAMKQRLKRAFGQKSAA